MKHRILILLLFFAAPAAVFSQTIFTAGLTYCAGPPSHNPGGTGSRYAIDTVTFDLYVRSTGTTWSKAGDWLQFRTGTGTPAAPPSKFESVFAINAADSLYYYDGATWNHLNPSSSGGITGGGLPGKIGVWYDTDKIAYAIDFVIDTLNNEMGLRTSDPQRTLDVNGEVRIRDLTTDPATKLVGTDTDGDLSSLVLGTNLSISGDTLNAASPPAGVSGTGLANRLAYWTDSGAIGYGEAFSVDTTNKRLSIVGSAGDFFRYIVRNNATNGYSEFSAYNSSGSADANRFTLGTGGSAAATPYASTAYLFAGTSYDKILMDANKSTGSYTIRIGDVERIGITTSVVTIKANAGVTTKTINSAGDDITGTSAGGLFGQTARNTSSTGYSEFAAYNNTSTASGNRLAFGVAGTSASFNDWATSAYVVAGSNQTKMLICTEGAYPLHFRTNGTAASSNKLIIESGGNIATGNFTAAARLDVRGAGTTSATSALDVANSNDSTILLVRNDRRVGVNTATPDCELDVTGTGGIAFPSGTTAQRLAVDNQIRTDTDVDGVEVRYRGDWYRLTSDVTPSVSAGAGLGSGGSVSCVGNDLGGTITFTTGSTAVTGDLFTATFAGAFSSGNVITVTFSARNAAAAAETAKIYVSAESTTAFTLTSWTALTDETEYKINYKISQ